MEALKMMKLFAAMLVMTMAVSAVSVSAADAPAPAPTAGATSVFIYKPLPRSDVLELQAALDMAQDLPQTLVQAPDMNQLQNYVDRMKHVGDVLNVSISKSGDLHLQISTTLVTLGAEFRKLVVVGEQAAVPPGDENLSAQIHSRRAIERGDAMSVQRKRFLALTELRFELLLLVSSSFDFHPISISLLSLEFIFVW
ncbi:hypothetical protein L2E82_04975 [Cichorium intybus]|uniref:Uncharacterized protein n=1 Tax=Cichorium intybus TaxID=13427 RepID=A0ACB9H761_CICIN|nr:hypothetical protein L2E82_04975 [Cichorium intybus]